MIASLVIYDKHGQLAAIVDVKKQLGTNREWATQLRSNLFAHGIWPKTPYFLAIVPDHIYLWKNAPNTPDEVEPDYEIESWELLKPYYDMVEVPLEKVSVYTFDFLIGVWLTDLWVFGIDSASDRQRWLSESGFWEVLKDGRIVAEADI